ACGSGEADDFQRPPEIAHQKTAQRPQLVVQETALMTVYQKQALQGVTIFQNQAFRSPCLLKNIFRLLRRVAGIEVTGGADKAFSALYDIVVAVNQEKPVFLLELPQQPEETAVGAQNHADAPVFPELISVSQLDIGVS